MLGSSIVFVSCVTLLLEWIAQCVGINIRAASLTLEYVIHSELVDFGISAGMVTWMFRHFSYEKIKSKKKSNETNEIGDTK